MEHVSPPNGTPAWVCVAPPGSSGLSVSEELAKLEALGWTNGPNGTWDSLHYWHSRAQTARFMWKNHCQWLRHPPAGIMPTESVRTCSPECCDDVLALLSN